MYSPKLDASEVWLAGVDPFVRNVMQPGSPSDYIHLFDNHAAWPNAAKRVRIFKTSTQYLLNAADKDLQNMFRGLQSLHITLGVEGLMIPRPSDCGMGVEGFSAPSAIRDAALRTQKLGGVIGAVAMDEPLWFGHHYIGSNACKWSVRDVARAIALNVNALHEVFPQARIGDTEPLELTSPDAWIEEIMQFADEYQRAVRRPLDFFHADVDWNKSWEEPLRSLAKRLRGRQIPFGVIYDGDNDDLDDAWTVHAAERFASVEGDSELSPDEAILQTWMIHPIHMLPESMAGTMTNLVLLYARVPSRIELTLKNEILLAHLVDDHGRSIIHGAVSLFALDASEQPHLSIRHVKGIVPRRATHALMKLVLTNNCQCSEKVSVRISSAVFGSTNGRRVVVALPNDPPASVEGGVVNYNLSNGEAVAVNSNTIDVYDDEEFDLEVPLGATVGADAAGYAAIIFLDADGMEVHRREIILSQSRVELLSGLTFRTSSDAFPRNYRRGRRSEPTSAS